MTETVLVLLRSSTPIAWKYHDRCLLRPFAVIKSLRTIEFSLPVTLSSKHPVVTYWLKLLPLIMFIPISEIRWLFLPYFPSERVLRLQTRGIQMREQRECHSSKSMKQLRDQFVKMSRFSFVLFHLIILSSVSIGSFPEPSYPPAFSFALVADQLTYWPCYLASFLLFLPFKLLPALNLPIKAKPRTRPCESTSATLLPSKILKKEHEKEL